MASLFLNRLSAQERSDLEQKLWVVQHGNCFICEKSMDLVLHKDGLDVDHVIPLKAGGRDDSSNFALTHASCNRSKQATHLEVARILQRFVSLKEALESENRSPNLSDILKQAGGGKAELTFKLSSDLIEFTLNDAGDNTIRALPVHQDELSGFRYFFVKLPIRYLRHDDRINPRPIGANIGKLVEEFHQRRPQLHIPLAWMTSSHGKSAVHVFDGQHKAAAQIMLGVQELPVRVFIDPEADTLITTNFNAGTSLKQVAFDKSVQRHLGSTLYRDRIDRYRLETERAQDDLSFSERDLVNHYKGQSREMKRYILDAVRDAVTSSPDNKLRDFIDYGGRGKERPLSYSSVDKTFYSFFVYQEVLESRLDYGLESAENPRELETAQIVRLMNVIAEEIYIGKFDSDIGTDKIESRLQKGEQFALPHLRAFRMSKEEVVYNWLKFVQQIAYNYFINMGKPIQEERLFQNPFPEQLWNNIRNFIRSLAELPLWANKDLSETVFGGKANNNFWHTIFTTGKSPQGILVMPKGINLVEMIK
ncbi:HNH endonuclease signature motif containing protein [Limnohabitans sp.]|uniref:HNH endonuclease n=1 Tax=Limnohabitans sp. TaxID=1907725 RepID=UPI00286F15F0|nr:HNH endonuclease signature motif containing protein [Limnohabitans sp.]